MELDIWVCPVCEQDNSSKKDICSNCGYKIMPEELEEEENYNDFFELILLDEEEDYPD
jgi:hypothetical protein